MFNTNISAVFKTEKGSKYTVDQRGVKRDKIADPSRATEWKEKNIYYQTQNETNLVESNKNWEPYLVVHRGEEAYELRLRKSGVEDYLYVGMTVRPEIGLFPLDLFLESNGEVMQDHGMHFGNAITEYL
jgi:hypothetical protein